MCTELHPLVLHDFASIHDTDPVQGSAQTFTCMQDETYVEPYMLEFPVAASSMEEAPTHAPSDVEQPRHAAVTYIFMFFF